MNYHGKIESLSMRTCQNQGSPELGEPLHSEVKFGLHPEVKFGLPVIPNNCLPSFMESNGYVHRSGGMFCRRETVPSKRNHYQLCLIKDLGTTVSWTFDCNLGIDR